MLAAFELTPTVPLGEKKRQRDQESRRSHRPHPNVRGLGAARLLRPSRLLGPRYAFATIWIVKASPAARSLRPIRAPARALCQPADAGSAAWVAHPFRRRSREARYRRPARCRASEGRNEVTGFVRIQQRRCPIGRTTASLLCSTTDRTGGWNPAAPLGAKGSAGRPGGGCRRAAAFMPGMLASYRRPWLTPPATTSAGSRAVIAARFISPERQRA